ncbi:rho guanine nucleotide exchange factor 10 isoform X1 [Alligator mississippiensis]|uniref:rho guanine nucleotide exchange factor 10 isoform X1 n=1 Tax=Alligator mississippiensis TaxID=8496 RepID=UPI002877B102|nr:rho guanine nucleotide exchange factor 10 isoform X1 [Alligator mississippiensis]XP_059586123.1 rho guanine nucleotide exchange factor 10 isoform X1 [Alligator mississippiensis]XP_059586125.1 rho guanine nucleotide exchange factor 10 isoform X1 [Alligator mississippiensis]
MDAEEFPPPPPPEVLENELEVSGTNEDEEEGEPFDLDSGDEIPEADRQALMPRSSDSRCNIEHEETSSTGDENVVKTERVQTSESRTQGAPTKVNPYSVINISPIQEKDQSSSPEPSPQDESTSTNMSGGYSVPVPCGYAVPSNLPLILPAYSSPVIIRSVSVDEEAGMQTAAEDCHFNSLSSEDPQNSEDNQVSKDNDALAKWVADPANTAWMENPDEVIYDDVPRENSDSEPEEMIYDDVENGDDGGNSSLDYGWSSSEFESYEEQSDSECKNGVPSSFLRGNHKRHLSHDLTRLKEHYEKKMKDLMANTVGALEIQQLKQKHELKMQKLMRAAREGTKDGLEKTKAAVKKGRSFIRTKSFISQDHRSLCLEEDELHLFIDVDCMHTEAIMTPMPEGLSQQQVVRRYILGSVVDSEKNYVDALKRILEQYEKPLSEMEPKLLSERKLKMVFYRIKEILQCHSMFQIALASRVSDWDSVEMIGDVFVASFSKSMVLDAYSEYVNNFSTAVGILKKTCATKPAFLDFLKQCQESSPDRITLYGLMMKPIQRFPQFILLLQDMLKNTTKGHPDRLPLQMALTELETLAEKLNERKRDADQRCEIKQIAKAMNERYLNKLLSSGNRYLIRTDDMIETVYNDKGEIVKTKERRLFMLNDVLMCATVSARSSYESSGIVATGQRYLLKWSVPLGQVEVIEYGSSEGQGENCRFPPQHSAENVVVSVKPNKLYMGPGQLYHDLQNLLHDLNVIGQISQLIGSLKGNYQNLNQSVAHDWTSGLQKLILKKEDEIRAADRCRIQLQLPGKQDKSGRPTFFTAVFNTFTPAIKQSWINNLQMAKLALAEENLLGWFCAEDDGNQIKKEKHPLLVRHMPVMMAKQQEFKIECAAYNPEPYVSSETEPDSCSMEHGFLWIGSCTNQMGQIAIVSFQNSNPKVIECFNVESRILCMVYIPDKEKPRELNVVPESENGARKASSVPTICLGMEEGSISVYKSHQGSKKFRLQHFFTPEKSTVMSLAYMSQYLFAGLVNGNITIYTKAEDGNWNPEPEKVVKLGVLPVRSLLVMEETIWAASGGQIFIISTETHSVEHYFEAHQEEGMVISHMAVAGVGIWIAFTSGSTLRLFHTETLKHLQDINIATPIHNILSGQQRVSVTSLLVCHGLLLVGTNLGIIVALPVPRLQGIPKVTGRGMVSYHAHNGPVKFLIMAAALNKKNRSKSRSSLPRSTETNDDDQKNALRNERPGSALSNIQDTGVWLGGSAGSITQRSDLSSSSGSLDPLPHGSNSVEHRTEDSTIYELLKDQNISLKNKRQRSKKMKASSVLVISGGQGHRRINKKSKQQRQDELVSSVMVWQIPLLNI